MVPPMLGIGWSWCTSGADFLATGLASICLAWVDQMARRDWLLSSSSNIWSWSLKSAGSSSGTIVATLLAPSGLSGLENMVALSSS